MFGKKRRQAEARAHLDRTKTTTHVPRGAGRPLNPYTDLTARQRKAVQKLLSQPASQPTRGQRKSGW